MECRNERRRGQRQVFQQRRYPRSHFPGGFVRESYRKNRGRRYVERADQMRNPVRDDARLPAARAGQNQYRTFGSCYSFTLLGIETREEIHYQPFYWRGGFTLIKSLSH